MFSRRRKHISTTSLCIFVGLLLSVSNNNNTSDAAEIIHPPFELTLGSSSHQTYRDGENKLQSSASQIKMNRDHFQEACLEENTQRRTRGKSISNVVAGHLSTNIVDGITLTEHNFVNGKPDSNTTNYFVNGKPDSNTRDHFIDGKSGTIMMVSSEHTAGNYSAGISSSRTIRSVSQDNPNTNRATTQQPIIKTLPQESYGNNLQKIIGDSREVIKFTDIVGINRRTGLNSEKRMGMQTGNDKELEGILLALLNLGMPLCQLVLVYDTENEPSAVLQELLRLPQPKMVFRSEGLATSLPKAWKVPSTCTFALYFTVKAEKAIMSLTEGPDPLWHFEAWHVMINWPVNQFEQLALQPNIRRTRRLLNVVQTGRKTGSWMLYQHHLYASPGTEVRVTTLDALKGQLKTAASGAIYGGQGEGSGRSWKLANLHGAKLKAITFEWKPSVMYIRDETGNMVSAYGIDIKLIQALAEALNFTIVLQEPPPGELWGAEVNGSWTGMVGMLERNQADLGLCNLFLTQDKLGYVELSHPYDFEVTCFLASKAPPLPRWQSLAYPFNKWTWLTVLLGTIIIAVLLIFFSSVATR